MTESPNQELFETIEAYIRGTLSKGELRSFEERLDQDVQLQREVSIMRENILAIEFGAFTSSVKDISDEYQRNNPRIPNSSNKGHFSNRMWAIAAGIAILLSIGLWLFQSKTPDRGALFAEYFVADPGLPVIMGVSDNYAFYDAMIDYKSEKYSLAISKWEKLLVDNPHNDTLNYYLGCAHLNNESPRSAIPYFQEVLDGEESHFQQKALWYKSLSLFSAGKLQEFAEMQESIPDPHRSTFDELLQSIDVK